MPFSVDARSARRQLTGMRNAMSSGRARFASVHAAGLGERQHGQRRRGGLGQVLQHERRRFDAQNIRYTFAAPVPSSDEYRPMWTCSVHFASIPIAGSTRFGLRLRWVAARSARAPYLIAGGPGFAVSRAIETHEAREISVILTIASPSGEAGLS